MIRLSDSQAVPPRVQIAESAQGQKVERVLCEKVFGREAFYRAACWRKFCSMANRIFDEAFQNFAIDVFKGFHAIRNESDLDAWLMRVFTNRCKDLIRRLQTRDRREECVLLEDIPAPEEDDERPEHEKGGAFLRVALEKVQPAHQRQLLVDYYSLGLSYRQLAQMHGIPAGTARSGVFTARKRLAKHLKNGF